METESIKKFEYLKEVNKFIEVCDKLDAAKLRGRKIFKTMKLESDFVERENEHHADPATESEVIEKINALLPGENFLFSIFNNIPYMAWIKDINLKFIAVNNFFADAYEIDPYKLIGKSNNDLWRPELAARHHEEDKTVLLAGKRKVVINCYTVEDGSKIWVEVTRVPIFDKQDKIIGILGIARDITEFQEISEELKAQFKKEYEEMAEINEKLTAQIGEREKAEMMLNELRKRTDITIIMKDIFLSKAMLELNKAVKDIECLSAGLLKTSSAADSKKIKRIRDIASRLIDSFNNISKQ